MSGDTTQHQNGHLERSDKQWQKSLALIWEQPTR